MSFKEFISKLFSFNSFLIIDLRDCVATINEIVDKKDKFFNVDILLLSYLYYSKINNILFLSILKTTSYLFIYII